MKKLTKEKAKTWYKALKSNRYTQIRGEWWDNRKRSKERVCGMGCLMRELQYDNENYMYEDYSSAINYIAVPPHLQEKVETNAKNIYRENYAGTNKRKLIQHHKNTHPSYMHYVINYIQNIFKEEDLIYDIPTLNDRLGFTFDDIAECVEYTYGNRECVINRNKKK